MNAVQKARERMSLTYVRINLRHESHGICNQTELTEHKPIGEVIQLQFGRPRRLLATDLKPSFTAAAPDNPHTRLQWRPC